MVGKIAVVTDSTADLDHELAEQNNITVVPLSIHFGDEVFKDRVELRSEEFFQKLEAASVPPRTSQPSPGDFHRIYQSLFSSGYQGIISIHISMELSGTWQSACIARDMLPDDQIQVINSKSASMGLGLIVLNTVKKVREGISLSAAASYASSLSEQQRVLFGVDTLEYLHRNGRIGRAAKLVGGLLKIKPLLYLDSDGFVAPLTKIRGKNKIVSALVEQGEQFIGSGTGPVDLAVVHSLEPELATEIAARVSERIQIRDTYLAEIGSVIGTHVGPGTVGIVLQKC